MKVDEILKRVVSAADDKRAQDITVMDMRGISMMTDYFVICSGDSSVQVRAIYRAIEDAMSHEDVPLKRRHGSDDSRWVLLDYGDVVVHVFHHSEREYYDLEHLWGDADQLDVQAILAQ